MKMKGSEEELDIGRNSENGGDERGGGGAEIEVDADIGEKRGKKKWTSSETVMMDRENGKENGG